MKPKLMPSRERLRWPLRAGLVVAGVTLATFTFAAPALADAGTNVTTPLCPIQDVVTDPIDDGGTVNTSCIEIDPESGGRTAEFSATASDPILADAQTLAQSAALLLARRAGYGNCQVISEAADRPPAQPYWKVTVKYECTKK